MTNHPPSPEYKLFNYMYVHVCYLTICMDGVKVASGNRGMTVEAAQQCAKDRKEWRALGHVTE